ncbi:hypothetical protein BGW38_003458, partial [Lunasporangiospora selenospora]
CGSTSTTHGWSFGLDSAYWPQSLRQQERPEQQQQQQGSSDDRDVIEDSYCNQINTESRENGRPQIALPHHSNGDDPIETVKKPKEDQWVSPKLSELQPMQRPGPDHSSEAAQMEHPPLPLPATYPETGMLHAPPKSPQTQLKDSNHRSEDDNDHDNEDEDDNSNDYGNKETPVVTPMRDGDQSDNNMGANKPSTTLVQPFEESLRSAHLDNDNNEDPADTTQYLTYLPYAGITNQFYGVLRGIALAQAMNRTLILPPITSSSHDKGKQHQPWSELLDLDRFRAQTGIRIVEMHQLRNASTTVRASLRCHVTCGFGSKRSIDFTATGFLNQWKMDVTLESSGEPKVDEEDRMEVIVRRLEPLAKNQPYICVSNAYKVTLIGKPEWKIYGQYLYFTSGVEDFVRNYLYSKVLVTPPPKSETELSPAARSLPPFIAIHVRRGDFIQYCEIRYKGPRMAQCLPSVEAIAERVEVVQERLQEKFDERLPVIVATNERRPEELEKFANQGWHVLDHEQMGTADVLGFFGSVMVDQAFLAHAETLIGIQMSTFSRVGMLRQRSWNGRETEYL